MPNMADFLGDGFEYVFLSPEGVKKVETTGVTKTLAEVNIPVNNIAAIAGSGIHPDFIVAQETSITYYSFDGDKYISNPVLSSTGYTNIMSVGTKELDHAALTDKIQYSAFTGSEMTPVPALSASEFSNPIAMTVFKDHYGTAVIDGDTVKYFKEGNTVTASITGLTNALSISAADGGNLAVVTDNQVLHYNLIGSEFVRNDFLSITSGLISPTCVALRPGSFDRLIVDGENINYYMWDGKNLVLNPTMSETVEGLQNLGKYLPKAVAESMSHNMDRNITAIKLYIDPQAAKTLDLPEGTSVKWYITASEDEKGDPRWIEVKQLNKWVMLGENSGKKVRWKAELQTTDRGKTPIIYPDIVLQTNTKPDPPSIEVPPLSGPDRCYLNSTPVIRWKFNDPDNAPPTKDKQGAYEVIVWGGSMPEASSGIIAGEIGEYEFDKEATGKLYESGVSIFNVKVRVWDEVGKEAGCPLEDVAESISQFCVIAFDRPYIDIITPPNSGHVFKNSSVTQILGTKAGGLVTLRVYSIGVGTASFKFPYLSQQSTLVGEPKIIESKGSNNCWEISFYTDANTDICPDGTIVNGSFTGSGIPNLMFLNQSNLPEKPTDGIWWQWEGYRKWADGLVRVGESAFQNWSVVLQGSKRK